MLKACCCFLAPTCLLQQKLQIGLTSMCASFCLINYCYPPSILSALRGSRPWPSSSSIQSSNLYLSTNPLSSFLYNQSYLSRLCYLRFLVSILCLLPIPFLLIILQSFTYRPIEIFLCFHNLLTCRPESSCLSNTFLYVLAAHCVRPSSFNLLPYCFSQSLAASLRIMFYPFDDAKVALFAHTHNFFHEIFTPQSLNFDIGQHRMCTHTTNGIECRISGFDMQKQGCRDAYATPLPHPLGGMATQYASSYNLKACILRSKTHGFAFQYAAYCRPICRVLQKQGLFVGRRKIL